MSEWVYFGAGFLTPFFLVVAASAIRDAVTPDGRTYPNGFCDVCEALGKPRKTDFSHTPSIIAWIIIKSHTWMIAKTPGHRRAWQAATDALPPGPKRARREQFVARFGTRRPAP